MGGTVHNNGTVHIIREQENISDKQNNGSLFITTIPGNGYIESALHGFLVVLFVKEIGNVSFTSYTKHLSYA